MTGHPDNPAVLLQAAGELHRAGRRGEAIEIFRRVLATRPESAEGWYELGYLLKAEGRYDEALEAYQQALNYAVARPEEVHLNRAVIFSDQLRRDAEAERELRAAIELNPDYVPALLNLGNLHEERGELSAAIDIYARMLAVAGDLTPQHADLRLEGLARTAKLQPAKSLDDPILPRLVAAASEVRQDPVVRANLLFALGESHDKLADYDTAFDWFCKANRCLLRQSGRTYDQADAVRFTDSLISAFASAGPSPERSQESGSGAPLFICGMFRSGSTLIEQVLAGHSQVTPGGEVDFLLRLAAARLAPFPASMAVANPDLEAALANEYRGHIAALFPDGISGAYVTDKRPDNFILIGLIKRLFPAAKIIHCTRHPLDTGLSIFAQHLHLRVAKYSADLRDIGHYIGEQQRLMTHWKALYPESIYQFDYDRFVADPRPELEGLLTFLGLDWQEDCLGFHRLTNTVKTASYLQIRKPLHGGSSGRWRHYQKHLGPLRQALVSAGVSIDGG